ncbi:uncharacterized protein EV422DRAFT_545155 [Fimicolochytrium jonesii]|uniref:uncharacterized protein n=1 Tax=Fimicolochytrium jonesii TaxID=1396493 RepID=UPI0022FE095A|nr:uncharacterized protein EV422DRAFT_545155 [Fimicolochytrium jonesii]KAI8816647.1 hypothetical protein EV422DRAFT_545155 [Fimicolochytrium jonesii]
MRVYILLLLPVILFASRVSATVYALLNQSFLPPTGVRPLRNVDFPLLRTEYTSLAGSPNRATFHDPNAMGVCRLANFSAAYEALNPTTLLNPNLALISVADAYGAGCPRYQYLAYANGWHEECADGMDVIQMLSRPGLLPCSTTATRPKLALWVQLGPVDPWCCQDPLFGSPSPLYGYNMEVCSPE